MRKMLNTLFVTTENAYLSKDGENVVVTVDKEETFRIPVLNIESIVSFSYMGASPGLMKLCGDRGVSLTFLTPNGRFIGHVQGPQRGNVLLRKAQYKISEDLVQQLHLGRLFIAGKVQNYYNILRRAIRDNGEDETIRLAAERLKHKKDKILKADSLDNLRGLEGDAASEYFSVLPRMIIQQKEDFSFSGRNKRPPCDAVNAMLSFAYTLLANDVTAALEAVGLDPYVGFFHTLRPGRPSLALDMMEEFRAYLGDRLVLSLINKRQITATHFRSQGDYGIVMDDNARKTLITAWQSRKREQVTHPFTEEKIPIGLLPHVQAMLLARYLRGDLDDYPVFLIP